MSNTAESPVRVWMQALYDENGYLTPELVRDAARDESSPAHGLVFNADVPEAAEAYYLEQAHKLIQRIRITHVSKSGEREAKRLYLAVPGSEESAYVYKSIDDLVRYPDQLQLARNEAVRRLKQAEKSVEDLDALVEDSPGRKQTRKALTGIRTAREALAVA